VLAARIGVSCGGDLCVVKLGREGKKSAEGSVAMFATCVGVGLISFSAVNLSEYAVVVAALAATVTELYEPFGLNDNLTIPMITSLALSWGFQRTSGL
jgi:dolichol kinase